MTEIPASHHDLLDQPVATIATIDDAGLPQLTVVWFLYDDGELRTSLNTGRVKYRNLRTRSECSLLILDLQNPYRYLEVRGRAEITPDDDDAFARKLGEKYGGADVREYDAPGTKRVVVTIRPERVHAVDMSS